MKNLHKSKLARKSNYLILLIFTFVTTLILLSMKTIVVADFGSSAYTTSIYFFNTGSTELTVRGTVYNEDGSIVGTSNSDLVGGIPIAPHENRYLTDSPFSGVAIEQLVRGTASGYQGWLALENALDNFLVKSLIRSKDGGPLGNMSTEVEKTVTANSTSVFKVLGIPSIDNYEKGFIRFCNTGTTSTTIRGTLYNEDSSLVGTPESILIPSLNPKAMVVMDLYQLAKAVNGGPAAGKLWLEVQADSENVSVQLLFETKFPRNNMMQDLYPHVSNMSAEIKKTNQNGTSFFNIFNIPTAKAMDIGVIRFYNTGNTSATVRGTLYNQKDGQVIGTPDAVLITSTDFIPHKIITLDIEDLTKIFDGIGQIEGRVWLKAQADSENVSIQLLSRYKGGGPWIDNSSEVKGESENTLFKLLGIPFPGAIDQASIYIYNTGTTATTVQGTFYDKVGLRISLPNQLLSHIVPKGYAYLTTSDLSDIFGFSSLSGRGQLWINTDSADVSVQFFLTYRYPIDNLINLLLRTNYSSANSTFIPIGFTPPSSSNTPPKVANITKIDNITLTRADFTNIFTDANGDRLTHIKIESLPKDGILKLNDIAVNIGDEIKAEELDNLVFTPNDNWHGATRFAWNGRDFTLYANKKAVTNLVINPLTLNLKNIGMEGSSGIVIASPGMNNGFNCQPETNCAEEYQYGSTVTLTVTPSDNSTFLGWVGGCKDSFTIKKNMNCKAVFDQANKPIDCSDKNITIETISSGDWNLSTTWQRLAGNDLPNEPIKNDIVRINGLHTITSPFYAIKMKALCIKPEATLTILRTGLN